MKHLFYVLFPLVLVLSGVCDAQNLEGGIKLGIQKPKFWTGSFFDVTSPKDKWRRPSLGVFGRWYMNSRLLSEYNLDLSYEGGGFDKRRTNLTVLKQTVFFGVSTRRSKPNSFNLKLGFSLNHVLKAEWDDKYTQSREDVKPYFKSLSTSLPFSLGYVWRLGPDYALGLNLYFQMLSGPLGTQEHVPIAQTFQRTEITLSRRL